MTHPLRLPLLVALVLGAASPALAQTAEPAPPPAAGSQDTPGQAIPPSTDPCATRPDGTAGQTLSGQLADCGGVLVPPDMAPSSIEAPVPVPDPGTTPVIPPGALPEQPANPT